MIRSFSMIALLIVLGLSACKESTSYPIGKQDGAAFRLNEDISKAKKYFDFVLAHSKLQNSISKYEIVQQKDKVTGADHFILLGSSADDRQHIAIELFEEEGQLGITSESLTGSVVFCMSDCENGCRPQRSGGAWTCSEDCGSPCSKTETRAYEENNYTTPVQAFLEKY